MSKRPRILLFTGEGKGKTTAALGMTLRAAGHGMRVLVIQFVKQDASTGEIAALRNIEQIELVQTGRGFVPKPDDPHFCEHQAAAEQGLVRAAEAIRSGQYELVVLDEVCVAVSLGLLEESEVIKAVLEASGEMRLALTGRHATPGLIELADTVSEIRCVKHAYDAGIPAQKGVEM